MDFPRAKDRFTLGAIQETVVKCGVLFKDER
jgi:hypothetical protein